MQIVQIDKITNRAEWLTHYVSGSNNGSHGSDVFCAALDDEADREVRSDGLAARWILKDGSSIVIANGRWDIGYGDRCWCLVGAGHLDDCLGGRDEREQDE